MSRKSSARSTKPPSPRIEDEFSLAQLLKENAEIARRQAERERMLPLLATNASDIESNEDDEGPVNADTERVLGKESNDKLKGALSRIGDDVAAEGGSKFFRCKRNEREFDVRWIENIEWLKGFEGLTPS